jgi:hypothetical protein
MWQCGFDRSDVRLQLVQVRLRCQMRKPRLECTHVFARFRYERFDNAQPSQNIVHIASITSTRTARRPHADKICVKHLRHDDSRVNKRAGASALNESIRKSVTISFALSLVHSYELRHAFRECECRVFSHFEVFPTREVDYMSVCAVEYWK